MSRRRGIIIALVIIGSLVAVSVLFVFFVPGPGSFPPSKRSMQLCGIGKALATYAVKYGSYPYSAAGEGSSLYLLKDLVPATIFEIPDHPDPTGHPHYDDSVRKLECSGYRYLNKPLSWTTEPDANSICVIAVERADLTGGRINALFSDGHEEFVGGDISWALLGRTYKELKNSAGNN